MKKYLLILFACLMITGCQQTVDHPPALKISERSPALNATEVAETAALSATFSFQIVSAQITKDNFLTEYAEFGASHTAGDPTMTSMVWSSDSKSVSISISGWSDVSTLAASVVHIVPRSEKIKDVFGNNLYTSLDLWKYSIGPVAPLPAVATPTFALAAGDYEAATVMITIECATASVGIRYTTDGSTPDQSSNLYTGTFTIDKSYTIKAIAMKTGYQDSDLASAAYNLTWWEALGGGVDDTVYAVVEGSLYVAGSFLNAGGSSANRIAKWDGSSWSALGSGVNGPVNAIAVDSSGNVYVGGTFTIAGEIAVNNIAKWNGSSWEDLSGGITGSISMGPKVYALALDDSGNLYVGGDFKFAGAVPMQCTAIWNGSSWSAWGTGMNGAVRTIAHDPATGSIYAGGSFDDAGGTLANYIAKWDGASWSELGSGTDGTISCIALDQAFLYVGGGFSNAGGVSVGRVARWDGSNWYDLDGGVQDMMASVHALTLDNNGNLYIGGVFTTVGGVTANGVARWDGSSWSAIGAGIDNTVYGLNYDSTNLKLYAGGYFPSIGDLTIGNVAVWGRK